jgi:hypothetical protein
MSVAFGYGAVKEADWPPTSLLVILVFGRA